MASSSVARPLAPARRARHTGRRVTILEKKQEHYSKTYDNAPMPNMQRLTWTGIAMHSGNLPGYPASHGCIRIPYDVSQLLFSATGRRAAPSWWVMDKRPCHISRRIRAWCSRRGICHPEMLRPLARNDYTRGIPEPQLGRAGHDRGQRRRRRCTSIVTAIPSGAPRSRSRIRLARRPCLTRCWKARPIVKAR